MDQTETRGAMGAETEPVDANKYWYHTTVIGCPICGRSESYKVRMYTKKPSEWYQRYELIDKYDYCNE